MELVRLPETTQTLYAELMEQAIQAAAQRATTPAVPGTFVSKHVKGRRYWYVQISRGDRKEQHYLGPDSPALADWMEGQRAVRGDERAQRRQRARLCSMLVAGGATSESASITRVLRVLEDAQTFRLGGVLVGTLAFRCYGNLLGVRFEREASRTQDIDVAHDPDVAIALKDRAPASDLPKALTEGPLGFLAVPGLDSRTPATSFKIRGRELRVDFLTPQRGRTSAKPVFLEAFQLAAQPIAGLEYLLEDTVQAVVVGSEDVLVNVPSPARFALHKLVLARSRPATFQTKALKDLRQAGQLLAILASDRPADITEAWSRMARSRRAARLMREALRRLDEYIQVAVAPHIV